VCIEAICRAFPIPLGASLVLEGLFLGYKDLQEGFEGLWNTRLRIGRGIWDASADWSGACGDLASPLKILSFLSQTRRSLQSTDSRVCYGPAPSASTLATETALRGSGEWALRRYLTMDALEALEKPNPQLSRH
jgi:hypothetical protein